MNLLNVKVGDIIVLKEGTRFYKKDEQYLVIQINPTWRYVPHTHTGKTEMINKYFLLGNGNQYKVDLDEIDYVVRNIENKKGKKELCQTP